MQRLRSIPPICVLFLMLSHGWVIAESEGEIFDGESFIDYPADPRLDLGEMATFELSFRVTQPGGEEKPDGSSTPWWLLAHGDGERTSFAIQVDVNSNELILRRQASKYAEPTNVRIPFDARDGKFHYVAFSIGLGTVSAIIDDRVHLDFAPFELPRDSTFDLPLQLGFYATDEKWPGENGQAFKGEVRTLRIWRDTLSAEDLRRFADYRLAPPGTHPSLSSLVAYADFSDSLQYQREPIKFNTAGAAPVDKYPIAYFANSMGSRIVKLCLKSDPQGVTNFMVVSGSPQVPILQFQPASHLPPDIQKVRSEALTTLRHVRRPPGGQKVDIIRPLQQRLEMAKNVLRQYPPPNSDFNTILIAPDEKITAIFGTHDGTRIKTLGVRTNHGPKPWVGNAPRALRGPYTFYADVPSGAMPAGIFGRASNVGLHEIGVAYSYPADFEERLKRLYSSGRWIVGQTDAVRRGPLDFVQTYREPRRDDELALERGHYDPDSATVLPHGNYTTADCWRLIPLVGTNRLLLCRDSEAQTVGTQFEPVSGSLNRYRSPNGRDGYRYLTLSLTDAQSMVYENGSGETATFVRPVPYESGDEREKLPWGATFSLNERPTQVKASFVGYNVANMHPRDFQFQSGAPQFLFQYPEEDKRQYQPTDGKVIVPHGLLYRPDNEGFEAQRVEMVSNAVEHSANHRTSIGFNVGFSVPVLPIGGNVSYQRETDSMSKSRTQDRSEWTIARSIESRYALIFDKSNVQLSRVFRDRVLELRNRLLEGYDLAAGGDYDRFLDDFGTHYPYATTYGGMTYLQSEFTEKSRMADSSATTTRTLKGHLSLYASSGGDGAWSDGHTAGTENASSSKTDIFRTYGGSLSRGEGWSLPKGEEIPILMDLRPISELLSPLFFDDIIVWTDLRDGVERAFSDQCKRRGGKDIPASLLRWEGDYELSDAFTEPSVKNFTVRIEDGRPVIRDHKYFERLELRCLSRMPFGSDLYTTLAIKDGASLPLDEWFVVERGDWKHKSLLYDKEIPPGSKILIHFKKGGLDIYSGNAQIPCTKAPWSYSLDAFFPGTFTFPKDKWQVLRIMDEKNAEFSLSVDRGKLVANTNVGFAKLVFSQGENRFQFVADSGRPKHWNHELGGTPFGPMTADFPITGEYVELKFDTSMGEQVIRCPRKVSKETIIYK